MEIRYEDANGFDGQQIPSGVLDIMADDGSVLFSLHLKDGALEITTGSVCKHENQILDTGLTITPNYANSVTISRKKYTTD